VWDTRNKVPDSWDSVSSMSVVICGHSYDFINFRAPAAAGFDGIIVPITTVRILLEIVPDSPSKRSTSIALVFSPEPLLQLSLVQEISIGIFHAASIAV